MLIGNKYADNKLYRGIRHYDTLPLTSSDIHEFSDTLFMKNKYFMDNLLGSGTLNTPGISISSKGVSLQEPVVVLLEGDIALIQSDSEILKIDDIISSGVSDGILCIVGWYQSLNYSSTLRAYGGVSNKILDNDLIDSDLDMQVSTRYQLRWDTVLVDKSLFESDSLNISISLINRDATGEETTGTTLVSTSSKIGDIRVAPAPTTMSSYAVSPLYIIPILHYEYENSKFNEESLKLADPIKVGGVSIISSEVAPIRPDEGTIWYDLNISRFKIYIEGQGFIDTNVDYRLAQYKKEISITESDVKTVPSDILFNISFEEDTKYNPALGDILQVFYEGILLSEGVHYSVDTEDSSKITLKGFTTELGETITFNLIKLELSRPTDSSGGSLIIF